MGYWWRLTPYQWLNWLIHSHKASSAGRELDNWSNPTRNPKHVPSADRPLAISKKRTAEACRSNTSSSNHHPITANWPILTNQRDMDKRAELDELRARRAAEEKVVHTQRLLRNLRITACFYLYFLFRSYWMRSRCGGRLRSSVIANHLKKNAKHPKNKTKTPRKPHHTPPNI